MLSESVVSPNHEAIEFFKNPFHYFLSRRCLTLEFEQTLIEWFETDAPWRLVTTDFYEQYEFSMLHVSLPESISQIVDLSSLSKVREEVARIFNLTFCEEIRLVAHMLIPGQRIAVHNDYLTGEETHRLIIQLNRGLQLEDGGHFMIFNSFDSGDVHRIIRPLTGSGVGFEICENSNHAVSQLHGGVRFSLVYSFFAELHAQRN